MAAVDRLYDLLPTIYRLRDAVQGQPASDPDRRQPLRALMAVLQAELDAIRADTETTWDNWFIETCEEWLVPYIGEALGVRGLRDIESIGFSQRAYVANTLAYRRRKGTASVVEQLARDVTGYGSKAVEYFAHTLTTVHMQHVREPGALPAMGGTIDLRSGRRLERFGTPFDPHAHAPDVRRISSGRGRYNFRNLGIFLWRVRSFEVSGAMAAPMGSDGPWYRFHPLGFDAPLFNAPRTEERIESQAREEHVPHPLSRRDLCAELEGRVPHLYLDPDELAVTLMVGATPWPPDRPLTMVVRNLADLPDGSLPAPSFRRVSAVPGEILPDADLAMDPVVGRIRLNPASGMPIPGVDVVVEYAYGFAAEVGAGPFDRTRSHARQLGDDQLTFARAVSSDPTRPAEPPDPDVFTTFEEAIDEWNDHVAANPAAVGLIALADSRTYQRTEPWPVIELPAGARLHLVATGWNRPEGGGDPSFVAHNLRPVVLGPLQVHGGVVVSDPRPRPGGLFVNGVTLRDAIVVQDGDLEILDVAHGTLGPGGSGGIEVQGDNVRLEIRLRRCLSGAVTAAAPLAGFTAEDTLIHGAGEGLDLPGTAVTLEGCTILGPTEARTLSASSCLFADPVTVEQHQEGCVRFSFIPDGSRTPRRYRCQPDLAMAAATEADRPAVVARVRPRFVSVHPAHPGYALLDPAAPLELRTGGEGGSEVGVFHHLQHALREANLRAALRQYLRFGLEAGLFLES